MCHLLQNPKSDQNEISTYNVNALENRVVMRIESLIREDQSDISTNSPYCFYWKIIGTVNENLNFDIRVYLDTDCRVI